MGVEPIINLIFCPHVQVWGHVGLYLHIAIRYPTTGHQLLTILLLIHSPKRDVRADKTSSNVLCLMIFSVCFLTSSSHSIFFIALTFSITFFKVSCSVKEAISANNSEISFSFENFCKFYLFFNSSIFSWSCGSMLVLLFLKPGNFKAVLLEQVDGIADFEGEQSVRGFNSLSVRFLSI